MIKTISHFLIFLGLALFIVAGFLLYLRFTPQKLFFASYPETTQLTEHSTVLPTRMTIKTSNIDVPIVVSHANRETTYNGVSYLSTSPTPGKRGNSIVYGHNWTTILGNLTHTKPGETVHITYSDGSAKDFIVEYTIVVNPDETDVIEQTEDTRITIYTCTGFLDSKRFVVIAKPLV